MNTLRHCPAHRASSAHCTHRNPCAHWGGFTLVEVLAVLVVAALLAAVVVPSYKANGRRAGRLDAVDALTRVQVAQEQFRSLHGLYSTDFQALRGTSAASPQGRYRISLALTGPEAYLATATAQGDQAADEGCATLTLAVDRGYPLEGPSSRCWQR